MELKFEGWKQEDVDRLLEATREALVLAIKYTATEVWGNIRKEAPVDHGRLAGSFQLSQLDEMAWKIWSGVHYALHVHEGTGIHGPTGQPYEIRPVNKKALYWAGADHPVARVMHPGIPGNPYATRAMDEASKRTEEFISRALRETGLGGAA
ncbi:MAG: hypothetical protein QMD71_06300 [bacterium]|nr:hypothetical protein [bacterium]